MTNESILDGDELAAKCKEHINILNTWIENFPHKQEVFSDTFDRNIIQGDWVEAMDLHCKDFLARDRQCISAYCKFTKMAYTKLAAKVAGITIIGSEVIEGKNTAQTAMNACSQRIADYNEKAYKATTVTEVAYYKSLASLEDIQYRSWYGIYSTWLSKEQLYDEIDAFSVQLFANRVLLPQFNEEDDSKISKGGKPGENLRMKVTRILSPQERNTYRQFLESQGYSSEAAEYIVTNYPEMVDQLMHAPSQYAQNIKDDINERFMNDSAALYTPNYDNSLYRGDNTSNCYSFAMGMPVNPLTGEVFINGLQPGVLCGRYGEEGYDLTNQDYLKEVVEADMDAVGMNLSPVASSYVPKENETKMVLYFNSATGDYHWAVYNEDKGKWQQVIGQRTNAVDYYAYESGGCICLDYSKPLGSDPAVVPSSPEQGYTVTQVYVLSPQMG